MGIVVAAHQLNLERRVAVKLALSYGDNEREAVARLVREARVAAALRGRHVVRVFDVGTLEDGAPYIVMEYLEGQTLRGVLDERGRLGLSVAVEYALQVCEALAEAHGRGIVHRDIKPANLHLAPEPDGGTTLRVLDFGISMARGLDPSAAAHGTDAFVGSPYYVSPEQLVRARDVDSRTDVWSLGVVLHECVTGKVPFSAETRRELWNSILVDPAPEFARSARLPRSFERIVRRCLEKDPDARYPNVFDLARDLLEFSRSRPRFSLMAVEAMLAGARNHAKAAALDPARGKARAHDLDMTHTERSIPRDQPLSTHVARPLLGEITH
jgi:serine/threonine-protein kinase